MKKLLSVVLAIVMLLQTAALAAPSVVTTGDLALEVAETDDETVMEIRVDGVQADEEVIGFANGNVSADFEDNTFTIQMNGDVKIVNYFTNKSKDIPISNAKCLCVYEGVLFVLKHEGNKSVIYTYDVEDYTESVFFIADDLLDNFSLNNGKVYYLKDGVIMLCGCENEKAEIVYDTTNVESFYFYNDNAICFYEKTDNEFHNHEDDSGKILLINSGEIISKSAYVSLNDAELMDAYGTVASYSVKIGNQTIPFSDYPSGSYFTDNGKACASHSNGCSYSSEAACNCKLYYGSKNLLAIQCFGFARMVWYRLFGILGHSSESAKYTTVASNVSKGTVTVNYLKNLFMYGDAKPGAQIRTNGNAYGVEHSLIYMGCDESYFFTYEGNYDGHCKVGVIRRTWSEAATYFSSTKYGISYVIMPKNYPGYTNIAGAVTVTFNPNGGTSAPASQTFSGTSYITQEIPVKEGYTFLGWSTTADNTVDHMSGGKLTPTSNMTLYAVWKSDSEFVAETSFVYNNNRYEYYPVSLPWNSAKAFCEKQGGSLVSITSDEERDVLIEKLGAVSSYWIGASDAETEGTWTWSSGETFGYTHWADGEPSNSDDGQEDFACTISGSPTAKWNDVRVNLNVNGFVCEYSDAYDNSDSWTEWSEWSETKVEGSAYRKVESKTQYVYYHYILQFSDGKCGAYPIKSAEFNTHLPQYPTTHKDEHTYESDTQLSKKDTLYYGDESYDCYENKHCPNDYDYDNGENASYLYYRGTKTVYRYSDALYTVAYNPNGGTGAPSAQTKIYGLDVTLSSTIPTRAGYTFLGWATSASGSVEYTAGATYTANSDITLYAVWKSNAVSVTGVSLNKSSISLKIGETDTLTATVSPSNATNKNVSWKSSDNSVATVENGLVTAIGEGTATVTVTTDDGNKTASCTVTVTKPEELNPEAKATVTLSNVTGRAGDKVSVIVSLDTDEEINTLGFSDISYNEDVLTFDGFTQYEEIDEMSTLGSYDENKKIVVIALDEAQQFHGRVFAIDFKIKEGAADGRCAIDISPSVKFNHTEYAVNTVSGIVTVVSEILGDLNRDEYVDLNDAILLLQYSMFPDDYPIDYKGSVDFTKDGYIDLNDAILLLQYSMFPDDYPIQ